MKRTFFAIIMGLALIASREIALAQNDDKPVPRKPYLASVPDYGHWTVTFKYAATASNGEAGAAKTAATQDGFPSAIDTIKTGDLRSVVLTFSDGTSRQFTCQGNWVLSSTPKGPQLSIASPSRLPYVYYTTGFILLDGVTIGPSTFKEATMHNGVLAFHYKSGDVDVWIGINSMLPLAAQQDGVEVSYQFLPAPPKPFLIPQDQASALRKELEADQKVRSLR